MEPSKLSISVRLKGFDELQAQLDSAKIRLKPREIVIAKIMLKDSQFSMFWIPTRKENMLLGTSFSKN